MLPQNAHDSGLRGTPLFDSSRHHNLGQQHQEFPFIAPDGIHIREDRAPEPPPRQLGPAQYARPISVNLPARLRRPAHHLDTTDVSHSTNLEHMLRRKTPNGTLAAGYDGAPAHLPTNPPPLKHVVLPFADRFAHTQNGRGGMRASIQRSYSDNVSWKPAHKHWEVENAGLDPSRLPLMDLDDPSIANNGYTHGQHFVHNGPNIPTVLQPTYQPSLGPTASNDAGTYGPYYVDGRAQAYRPAAVRDTAAHPFNPRPGPAITDSPIRIEDDYFTARTWDTSRMRSIVPDCYKPEIGLTGNGVEAVPTGFNATLLPFRSPQHSSSLKFVPAQVMQNNYQINHPNRNHNAQFKERVLGWAHGIYIELLASITKAKQEAHRARKKHGINRSYSQNNIYPTPPRQTAFLMRRPSDPANYNDGLSRRSLNGHRYSPTRLPDVETRRRRSNSIVNIIEDKRAYASRVSPSVRETPDSYFTSNHQYGAHGQSPLSLYLNMAPPQTESLQDTARSALDMLETLCHESGWRWVDGMLLGGCLAYGLGDYDKALDWYSKITAIDER